MRFKLDHVAIAVRNVEEAAKYEADLPIFWRPLITRLNADTYLALSQFETAGNLARTGLKQALDLGMDHERDVLNNMLARIDRQRGDVSPK